MITILTLCRNLFGMMSSARSWHVEVHQFRIEARRGADHPEMAHILCNLGDAYRELKDYAKAEPLLVRAR